MLGRSIVIAGDVSLTTTLDGDIGLTATQNGDMKLDSTLDGECGLFYVVTKGSGEWEIYDGPYVTVSLADNDRYLSTRNKVMTNNVLVQEIPYTETENIPGGITVNIG